MTYSTKADWTVLAPMPRVTLVARSRLSAWTFTPYDVQRTATSTDADWSRAIVRAAANGSSLQVKEDA